MKALERRNFIKRLAGLITAVALFNITRLFADWPGKLFKSKSNDDILRKLTDADELSETDLITIKAPDIAENGAVVPITVSAEFSNVRKISILVDNNPSPLTSSYEINSQLSPYVSTRVKMAKTSNIIAIVTTDDGHFSASRNIKVTIGGCGG